MYPTYLLSPDPRSFSRKRDGWDRDLGGFLFSAHRHPLTLEAHFPKHLEYPWSASLHSARLLGNFPKPDPGARRRARARARVCGVRACTREKALSPVPALPLQLFRNWPPDVCRGRHLSLCCFPSPRFSCLACQRPIACRGFPSLSAIIQRGPGRRGDVGGSQVARSPSRWLQVPDGGRRRECR